MSKVIVVRFELYPKDGPEGYVVGFNVTSTNGRQFYRDLFIPFSDVDELTDNDIVFLACQRLKDTIDTELERLNSKSPILGMEVRLPEGELVGEEEIPEIEEE